MVTIKQVPDGVDIDMVQGDDIKIMCTVNLNLTGYDLEAKVEFDPEIILTINPIDLTIGKFYIVITKAQSQLLKGQFPWTLEWDDLAGKHRTVIQGFLKVARNV